MEYSLPKEQVEVRVKQYKPFPGKNIEQMPLLLGEGRSPLWAARFMRRRIDHANELPELRNYLDVSDLIAYDSKKRSTDVKFVLTVDKNSRVTEQGRKALELINPNTELTSDYAVNIDDVYNSLPGIVVARKDLGVLERVLSEQEILESRVWRVLARHPDEVPAEFAEDSTLLKEYAGWVKGQTKQDKNMGIYLDNNSDVAKLRAWCVDGLEDWSNAYGGDDLDDDLGRFVGYLAPEAPNALGSITQRTASPERRILTVSEVLEETSQTSAYAPDQIKKLQDILEGRGYVISPK